MVSKIAVVAIVALVAIPVGLGYALNFENVETTTYTPIIPTNVTGYLNNSTSYEYTSLGPYNINTNNFSYINLDTSVAEPTLSLTDMYPIFNAASTANTSLKINTAYANPSDTFNGSSNTTFVQSFFDTWVPGTQQTQRYSMIIQYGDDRTQVTIPNVKFYQYDKYASPQATVLYYPTPGSALAIATYDNIYLHYATPAVAAGIYSWWQNGGGSFIDLSQGFRFQGYSGGSSAGGAFSPNTWNSPGDGAYKVLTTFDLNTVLSTGICLVQRITGGTYANAVEICPRYSSGGTEIRAPYFAGQEIIQDESFTSNVYQLVAYSDRYELHYIKDWPTSFGETKYYRSWAVNYADLPARIGLLEPPAAIENRALNDGELIEQLSFQVARIVPGVVSGPNPFIGKIRFDEAYVKTSPYPVMTDVDYDPTQLKPSNPSTKFDNILRVGDSITFGGYTYDMQDLNLHVGSRNIPLSKVTFRSIINSQGTYDNMINDNVVSTTAQPSHIVFNGLWRMDVISSEIRKDVSSENKFVPGAWAWKGLDVNFALVGLATCAAAFIGLGLYGKRSGAKVGTLMLVCAGGALVFMALL